MAEYDLKLVVDADTTEAQRKLDELAAAHNAPEVREAAARAQRAVPQPLEDRQPAPSPVRRDNIAPAAQPVPKPSAPPAPTPAQPAPLPQPTPPAPTAQPAPRPQPTPPAPTPARPPQPPSPNNRNNPEDFGRRAGDVAGRAIGKAVAGFMAHEVAGTIFTALKTTGGDNRNVNQAEAGVGGALRYGTMGAMLGGPLGAVIGGIGGAIMGVFQEQQRQQKVREARDNEIRNQDYARNRNNAIGAADSAFGKSLELAGGWRQRQEMIRARRNEIANGEGSWSVKNIEKLLKTLDPESDQAKNVAANLQMQKDRVASLDRQLLDEGLAVAPGRVDSGSVVDSWAKRGIQVGAQVDVAQVNEKIMGEVQSCRALLEKIANMANDGRIGVSKMLSAVYE